MNLQTANLWLNLNSDTNPDRIFFDSRNVMQDESFKNIENVYFGVKSLEEASEVCRRYITHFNLGSGNWTGGNVNDDSGRFIARISYNGRIWANEV